MGNARFLEDVEFGREENIRNVDFEEEPVTDSDQFLVPIVVPVPTSAIEVHDNNEVLPDKVHPQMPIDQAQLPQEV